MPLVLSFFNSAIINLAVKDAEDLALKNHKDEVENPDDVPSKEKADNTGNDFAFLKSCEPAQKPGCYRNDCKNYTYKSSKSKVIFSFCHKSTPL